MQVRANITPETFNEKDNTVDVVFTTDAPVRRYDFWEGKYFDEVLGMKNGEVRMERLLNKAPVLNSHNRGDLSDQIGVIETASIDGTKGHATLRLSKRESIKEIVQDIKDGIISNISVGYKIHKMEKTGEKNDIPTMRATDWEPLEVSFVTVPADGTAQVKNETRNNKQELFDCEIRGFEMDEIKTEVKTEEIKTEEIKTEEIKNEVKTEEIEVEVKAEVKTEVKTEVENEEIEVEVEVKSEAEVSKAERSRICEIQIICKKFDIDEKEAQNFIEKENSVEQVRKFIMDELAKQDDLKGTRNMNETKIEVGTTDIEKKSEGIANAMLAKSTIVDSTGKNPFALDDNGRNFNNMSLLRMAEVVLNAKGVNTDNMSRVQLAERAMHSTSDFKTILANVLGKSLRQGYEAAPQTFSNFTRQVEKDDLKEISKTQFGEGGSLQKVKEGEEYKHDTISEGGEVYKIEKFGKIINITEETLINDDLDAFTRVPSLFGQRAKDSESDEVWNIMTSNPNMGDGNALYSAAHSNLLTAAGVLGEDALSSARTLFRKQVGLDSMKLNLVPSFLAVPPELETSAEKLISSLINPNQASQINAFSANGRTPLSLIVEPRLSDLSAVQWYLFGLLGQIDMVEMAKLRGASSPTITQQEGFDIDGLRIKIKHRFGTKAIDHRGMLKSNGVA